jgi:hypothetical protein
LISSTAHSPSFSGCARSSLFAQLHRGKAVKSLASKLAGTPAQNATCMPTRLRRTLIESCWNNDAFSVELIPAEEKNDGLCIFFEQKTDSILSA